MSEELKLRQSVQQQLAKEQRALVEAQQTAAAAAEAAEASSAELKQLKVTAILGTHATEGDHYVRKSSS